MPQKRCCKDIRTLILPIPSRSFLEKVIVWADSAQRQQVAQLSRTIRFLRFLRHDSWGMGGECYSVFVFAAMSFCCLFNIKKKQQKTHRHTQSVSMKLFQKLIILARTPFRGIMFFIFASVCFMPFLNSVRYLKFPSCHPQDVSIFQTCSKNPNHPKTIESELRFSSILRFGRVLSSG